MNEELEQSNVDDTALVLQLEELTKTLNTQIELDQQEKEEPKTILVDGEEKTDSDLLLNILEVLTPDEQVQELQALGDANQMELLQSISESLIELNKQNEISHTEQIELAEEQIQQQVEGSFMVSLSIVTAFAVYMFWSQLSKW